MSFQLSCVMCEEKKTNEQNNIFYQPCCVFCAAVERQSLSEILESLAKLLLFLVIHFFLFQYNPKKTSLLFLALEFFGNNNVVFD